LSEIRNRSFKAYIPTDKEVQELKMSIQKTGGLVQPIVVRPHDDAYELVVGEARRRAVTQLGYETISAIIMHLDDQACREFVAAENYCRRHEAPITVAEQMKALTENGKALRPIGDAMGCSHEHVRNYLKLLKMPNAIQKLLENGQLKMTPAVAAYNELTKLTEGNLPKEQLQEIRAKVWSEVKGLAKNAEGPTKAHVEQIVNKHHAQYTNQKEKKEQPGGKQLSRQPSVDPQIEPCNVLAFRMTKEDLIKALITDKELEEIVEFRITEDSIQGPGGSYGLTKPATLPCTISLHRDYVTGLLHIVRAPHTKCKHLDITMPVNGSHLQIKSVNGETMLRLPAKMKPAVSETEGSTSEAAGETETAGEPATVGEAMAHELALAEVPSMPTTVNLHPEAGQIKSPEILPEGQLCEN